MITYHTLALLLKQYPNTPNLLIEAYLLHRSGNPSVVNSHFRKILEGIGFNYHKRGYSPKEIAYRCKANDWGTHSCIVCGKEVNKFLSFEEGFSSFCGIKCSHGHPIVKAKRAKTCMERYGAANPFGSEQIKNKIKKDTMERYGTEFYQQTDEFKEKWQATYVSKSTEDLMLWQQVYFMVK